MIEIRLVRDTDAPAIAQVRRDSWYAAYEGIIPAPIIDRATALGTAAASPPPYRRTLVAEARGHPAVIGYASFGPERNVATAFTSPLPTPAATPLAGDSRPAARPLAGDSRPAASPLAGDSRPAASPLAGDSRPAASPLPGTYRPATSLLTPDGLAGLVGELYALYVSPDWWSTGTGRALIGQVLASLEAEGYRRAILWVLADNTRARRFYERAGFAPDGGTNVLTGLGGVLEVRYARDLLPPRVVASNDPALPDRPRTGLCRPPVCSARLHRRYLTPPGSLLFRFERRVWHKIAKDFFSTETICTY